MSTPSDRPQSAAPGTDFAAELQAAVGDRYRIDGKVPQADVVKETLIWFDTYLPFPAR